MATITIYIFHHADDPEQYDVRTYDASQYGHSLVLIEKIALEFQAPTREEAIPACITTLNARIAEIQADAFKEVQEYQEKIQKLLCLEHHAEE